VDPVGLTCGIGILRASYNPGVRAVARMEPEEVAPIQSEEYAPFGRRKRQNFVVGDSLAVFSRFPGREDIVTERTKRNDRGEREVLVRVKAQGFSPSRSR
jgi:hypothetical protein